jgi:tRNA pseudouridine65 synthase
MPYLRVMLDILYRDSRLAAVNKPSGMLVHRTTLANDKVTCMTVLRDHLRRHVYPAHRLDRGTSGVLLFALDSETAALLSESLRDRAIRKSYLAIVRGWPEEEGKIDYALAEEEGPERDPVPAITRYRRLATVELPIPIGRYPVARYALMELEPLTGRTHQLRRHMAHIRHPIVGDTRHGEGRHNRFFRDRFASNRLLLHARELSLTHPHTAEPLTITAPLPEDLGSLVEELFGCRGPMPHVPYAMP